MEKLYQRLGAAGSRVAAKAIVTDFLGLFGITWDKTACQPFGVAQTGRMDK
jgi:hypothetical protein